MFNKGFGNDIKSGLLSKPIGLASKSYETMRDTLFRKIGSGYHIGDGYGTPIGEMMEQDLNDNRPLPWFYVDKKKNSTSNYIDYVNNSFFNGFGSLENNFITAEEKIRFFNYNSLRPEYNQVGAVRGYNIKNNLTSLMFDDGQTNPNSYIDTRLGLINGFYLNATLNNARNIYEKIQEGPLINDVLSRLQSSLTGEDGTIVTEKRNISKYVYTRFGFDGDFGMRNIENHMVNGRVLTQEELIGDAMPYGDFSTYGDYNTITHNSK